MGDRRSIYKRGLRDCKSIEPEQELFYLNAIILVPAICPKFPAETQSQLQFLLVNQGSIRTLTVFCEINFLNLN
jgi:hypothetical protein